MRSIMAISIFFLLPECKEKSEMENLKVVTLLNKRLEELKRQLSEQEERTAELAEAVTVLKSLESRIAELEEKAHVHKIIK